MRVHQVAIFVLVFVYVCCQDCVPATATEHVSPAQLRRGTHKDDIFYLSLQKMTVQKVLPHMIPCKTTKCFFSCASYDSVYCSDNADFFRRRLFNFEMLLAYHKLLAHVVVSAGVSGLCGWKLSSDTFPLVFYFSCYQMKREPPCGKDEEARRGREGGRAKQNKQS